MITIQKYVRAASLEEACEQLIRYREPIQPDQEAHEAYQPYFELYKDLYGQLASSFQRLAEI